MKSLTKHIEERLIVNKDIRSHNNLKLLNEIVKEIETAKNREVLYDILEKISKMGTREPNIYDDSCTFDTYDYFERWQDAFGAWDNTCDVIERVCNDNMVLGWEQDNKFDKLDAEIPEIFHDIMDNWEHEVAYKKWSFKTELWEKQLNRVCCSLLKLNMGANKNGTDYSECWYIFVLHTFN